MIHSDLLAPTLHTLSTDQTILNDDDSYARWIHQLPNPHRNFLSRAILDGWNLYDPVSEFKRMGIPDASWRLTNINADYEVCSTYPAIFAVPTCLDDHRIVMAAQFRSRNRLPAFSWRHPMNRCCLCRSSQPLVGLSQNRSLDDEQLLEAINLSSKTATSNDPPHEDTNPMKRKSQLGSQPLIIVDARPKINAQANQAAGKGYEIGKGYENCRVLFMGIANIHVMRKSIDMLEELCSSSTAEDPNWFKNIETTGWLQHVSRVLTASIRIVHCISFEEYSVLVHCSDGWDRTAQLTSLPMLMMDPFYRTYKGFMILVEKEWFSFGHKFADRLGWTEGGWGDAERSPVFHQFLDCVHQCLLQNPDIFEFNQEMLLFIGKHVLSGWFGNAFANSELERLGLWETTVSIWTFLDLNKCTFVNPSYQPLEAPYWIPNTSIKCLEVWELWFLKWSNDVWDLMWTKKNEDFSERHDNPSVWMDDNMTHTCCDCQKPFNFIRRRHHCRACGRIFCESCVKQTRILPNISETIPVRCCQDCSNQMTLTSDDQEFDPKSRDRDNSIFSKNSIAVFFGKKPSNEDIVLEDQPNRELAPSVSSSVPNNQNHVNERDSESLFGHLIEENESITLYPNPTQVASIKIDSAAAFANRPHHPPHDPKPIDHLLPINHRPFESLEYSDSSSEVDELSDSPNRSDSLNLLERMSDDEDRSDRQNKPSESQSKSTKEHNHRTKSKKINTAQKKDGVKSLSQRHKTSSQNNRSRSPSTSPPRATRSK
jgi:hypothetical protein